MSRGRGKVMEGGEVRLMNHHEGALNTQDMQTLGKLSLFAGLDEEEIREVLGGAMPRQYPRGKILFQHGDRADAFYVILDGLVKVMRHTPDGSEVILGVFGKGNAIAEASVFLGGKYPATAELAADSRLLRIEIPHFRDMLLRNPHLSLSMLKAAYQRIGYLVSELEHLKSQTGCQRVADFILSLCPDKEAGEAHIDLPYEKGLIAARLGMKPESFSRALKRLRQMGIEIHRDHVHVPDMSLLRQFAETGELCKMKVD